MARSRPTSSLLLATIPTPSPLRSRIDAYPGRQADGRDQKAKEATETTSCACPLSCLGGTRHGHGSTHGRRPPGAGPVRIAGLDSTGARTVVRSPLGDKPE